VTTGLDLVSAMERTAVESNNIRENLRSTPA
jgi:hypothetical protein